jgi:hypothetical protein
MFSWIATFFASWFAAQKISAPAVPVAKPAAPDWYNDAQKQLTETPVYNGSGAMSRAQIYEIADRVTRQHFSTVSPSMLTAMAMIESSGNPKAYRYEAHINDASYGLVQVLFRTALWLRNDMGYRAYPLRSTSDLMYPEFSLYFGGAFIHWLQRHPRFNGTAQWILESYNGGPNNSNSQTRNHWAKYQKERGNAFYVGKR